MTASGSVTTSAGPREPAAASGVLRVLVALTDPVARRAIAAAVAGAPDLECVGEVASGAEVVARVRAGVEIPQLVVLDGAMPDLDAATATRRIAASQPGVRVVVLASDMDEEDGMLALRAGAAGYLKRDISLEVLLRVLRKVGEGEAAVPRTLTARLLDRLRELPDPGSLAPPIGVRAPIALGVAGVLAGVGGLVAALLLPHSASEAIASGSAYVQPQYWVLLLFGSIEAIVFGVVLIALEVLRPGSRWLPTAQAVLVVVGVLLVVAAALVAFDYGADSDGRPEDRPEFPGLLDE